MRSTIHAMACGDSLHVPCSRSLTDPLASHPPGVPAGQQRWQLLSTLSGYHERTIFTVDWSPAGLIASGGADNAIRIFSEAAAVEAGEEAAAAAADAAAAEPSLRALFMRQPGGSAEGSTFQLLCQKQQAHPLDINCVRWHPADPTLLASAGDDGCIRLWRWQPEAASA